MSYAVRRARRKRFEVVLITGGCTTTLVRYGTNIARFVGSCVLGTTDGDLRRIRAGAAREVCGAAWGGSVTASSLLGPHVGPATPTKLTIFPVRA